MVAANGANEITVQFNLIHLRVVTTTGPKYGKGEFVREGNQ